jgi:protein-tyrosine phosphatase
VDAPLWIDLEGADNVRDVGGLPTLDGRQVQPGRLLRSDSLQELTDADVRHLVGDLRVRAVADLRTDKEVREDGPGQLARDLSVRREHFSLYPEAGVSTDLVAADAFALGLQADDKPGTPVLLPWPAHDAATVRVDDEQERRWGATGVYLRYLDDRGDSIIAALRLIAYTDGATIVHCAAGKDRTGIVVALALREVGVTPEAIVADYARSTDRIDAVLTRLSKRPAYAEELAGTDPDRHKPPAATMEKVLAAIDEIHGGAGTWLRANGWTDRDAASLRHKLLDAQPEHANLWDVDGGVMAARN